eukprot:m.29949 g.29949  ORF g.29949 m.29949 type:complete len:495 (-) comp9220_c1_seq1:2547-4031(-)
MPPRDDAPVPWSGLFAVFVSLFANAISMTLPLPFLPFMVKDFGVERDEDVGYYVGAVASAMFLGRLVCSYGWGVLMDRIGRRPVMLYSLCGVTASGFLFGFSSSTAMAIITRFLAGAFNGVAITSKTIISEICPPRLQAKAMTMLTTAWGAGIIGGSVIGGVLSRPADSWEMFDTPFHNRYPYFLPCFTTSMLSGISIFCVLFLLPETLERSANDTDKQSLLEADSKTKQKASFTLLLRDKNVRTMVLLYAIFAFAAIGMDEMHSVFCATPVSLGGLGWTTTDIGMSLAIVGVVISCGQMFLYPPLAARLKAKGVLVLACVMTALLAFVYPLTHYVAPHEAQKEVMTDGATNLTLETVLVEDNNPWHSNTMLWWCLGSVAALYKLFGGMAFISISLLINNSVVSERRGMVNGLAMTCTAIGRLLGPSIGGAAFSWSISSPHTFPFNQSFTFCLFALTFMYSWNMARAIPQSLNNPPEHERTQVQQNDCESCDKQ